MTTVNGSDDQAAQRPFAEGDPALLVDRRGRRYLITLTRYKSFHTHVGAIDHNDLIGRSHGARLNTTTGHVLLAFSPTLGDFVEEMPHQTQVIYAKDLGAILMHGDIFPGARVLEAGLGLRRTHDRVAQGRGRKRPRDHLRDQAGAGGRGQRQHSHAGPAGRQPGSQA